MLIKFATIQRFIIAFLISFLCNSQLVLADDVKDVKIGNLVPTAHSFMLQQGKMTSKISLSNSYKKKTLSINFPQDNTIISKAKSKKYITYLEQDISYGLYKDKINLGFKWGYILSKNHKLTNKDNQVKRSLLNYNLDVDKGLTDPSLYLRLKILDKSLNSYNLFANLDVEYQLNMTYDKMLSKNITESKFDRQTKDNWNDFTLSSNFLIGLKKGSFYIGTLFGINYISKQDGKYDIFNVEAVNANLEHNHNLYSQDRVSPSLGIVSGVKLNHNNFLKFDVVLTNIAKKEQNLSINNNMNISSYHEQHKQLKLGIGYTYVIKNQQIFLHLQSNFLWEEKYDILSKLGKIIHSQTTVKNSLNNENEVGVTILF